MGALPLVQLAGIYHLFNSHLVLKNINACFFPASINLITGNNGSGKTTLLKLVANIIKPTKGLIKRNFSQPVSYLGHENFVYSQLTPVENLVFWSKISGLEISRDDIIHQLAQFGLKNYLNEKTGVFSRGMLQKVNLARIAVIKSPLILLDEPFTGLDQDTQNFIGNYLKNLKNNGCCILVITHNPDKELDVIDSHWHLEKSALNEVV